MGSDKRLFPRHVLDYLAMLRNLLPRGLAWTRAPGSRLTRVLHGTAGELARVDASAHLLLDEVNRSGKLKKDDLVAFAGVGAGWTFGAAIYRWH